MSGRMLIVLIVVVLAAGGSRVDALLHHSEAGRAVARGVKHLERAGTDTAREQSCQRPKRAVRVVFSRSKYPNIVAHIERSWARGYPHVLRINRIGASERRDKLLQGVPTKPGMDRDEAPATSLRSTVKADVAYVPSHENRSAGSSLGSQIGGFCNGVRVVYVFTS